MTVAARLVAQVTHVDLKDLDARWPKTVEAIRLQLLPEGRNRMGPRFISIQHTELKLRVCQCHLASVEGLHGSVGMVSALTLFII